MIKTRFNYTIYAILLLLVYFTKNGLAQTPFRKGPASAEEIKYARETLEVDMNNFKSHRNFIIAMGIINPLVIDQYKKWMKKYPKNVNIPLFAGTVYYNMEMPQAKDFLLKSAVMNPKNPEVWYMLSRDASTRGQKKIGIEYLKKAMLADSTNLDYAFYYLNTFKDGDPNEYKQKVLDFVNRFPTDWHGAQALYWLAENTIDIGTQINYFEELHKRYSPLKFDWSASGMVHLTDIYLQTNPLKALDLINEMGDEKDWEIRKQIAETLINIKQLEQDQKYNDALTQLNLVKLPRFNYINDFIALKKSYLQEKNGNVKIAYDSLVVKFAKLPSDQLYSGLKLYGKKLGKDSLQIANDIDTLRNSTAVAAYPFELELYTSKGKLSLESLKGKVVLLTFWFPNCGPCRAEFPHFEAVLNKFKGQSVAYIGINVLVEQDQYVIPMLKNTKFSFIPLKGSNEFAAEHYGVKGEPENFLIDKNGKIIFKNFTIDESNRNTLELMISALL
jgi:thiol-disulfide isomerase/thioredoxin